MNWVCHFDILDINLAHLPFSSATSNCPSHMTQKQYHIFDTTHLLCDSPNKRFRNKIHEKLFFLSLSKQLNIINC